MTHHIKYIIIVNGNHLVPLLKSAIVQIVMQASNLAPLFFYQELMKSAQWDTQIFAWLPWKWLIARLILLLAALERDKKLAYEVIMQNQVRLTVMEPSEICLLIVAMEATFLSIICK